MRGVDIPLTELRRSGYSSILEPEDDSRSLLSRLKQCGRCFNLGCFVNSSMLLFSAGFIAGGGALFSLAFRDETPIADKLQTGLAGSLLMAAGLAGGCFTCKIIANPRPAAAGASYV